jgi:hypothetical protein
MVRRAGDGIIKRKSGMNPVKARDANIKASRRNTMKNMVHLVLMLSMTVFLANCGAAREQIRTQSITEREGVFQEVPIASEPPAGFADVVVKASLKTHLSGEGTLLESGDHGGEFHHFVLNIDDQAVTWEAKGVRENSPIVNGRHFPEEGDGMRYVLEKKIRLHAGAYSIFFGVPEENYTKTVTLNLQEGKSYSLEFWPIYPRHKQGHRASRNGFLGFNLTCDQTVSN